MTAIMPDPTLSGFGRPERPDAVLGDPLQQILQLLETTVRRGGSDLHITAGIAPCIRVHGSLRPIEDMGKLTPHDTAAMMRALLPPAMWERFEANNELDTSYSLEGLSRFRVNVFVQRGAVGAVLRTIPHQIRSLGDLGLPADVERFAHLPRGLVLVTGPTGSGKSTTLASLLDVANRMRSDHIMTIEDPIEYLHTHQRCVVNQREVGSDTADFPTALKHVLRQDPDVILVGELRDLETTATAVTAAETSRPRSAPNCRTACRAWSRRLSLRRRTAAAAPSCAR